MNNHNTTTTAGNAETSPDGSPPVIELRVRIASYPQWKGKPLAQRLEALRILLKHSGFMPVEITSGGNPGGE